MYLLGVEFRHLRKSLGLSRNSQSDFLRLRSTKYHLKNEKYHFCHFDFIWISRKLQYYSYQTENSVQFRAEHFVRFPQRCLAHPGQPSHPVVF